MASSSPRSIKSAHFISKFISLLLRFIDFCGTVNGHRKRVTRHIPQLRYCIVLVIALILIVTVARMDPDARRSTCEIINARGFPCETHSITTHQGYIIEVQRIPAPGGTPVILQAGLIGTSANFIMASSSVSRNRTIIGHNMGLELAKQGYDVWLTNNRGSVFGRRHLNLTTDDAAFWRFSWDQIAQYDTPALIDAILGKTGQPRLHYIGHSQGSALMFALLSRTDKYNDAVASFTAICPITRIGGATTATRLLIRTKRAIYYKGGEAFGRNLVLDSLRLLASELPIVRSIYQFFFFAVNGPDYEQLDTSRLSVYNAHMPTSTSAQNLLHYDQLFSSNRFAAFDHGILENQRIYGRPSPPEYNLGNITHRRMLVIYGDNDWFIPLASVDRLQEDIQNRTGAEFYLISHPSTNHIDPLIGKDVAIEVNKKVLSFLGDSPKGKMDTEKRAR